MDKQFSSEVINEQVNNNLLGSKLLLEDKDKMERFLQRLEVKLKKIPIVGKNLSNVPLLISLVRSYVQKDYKDIPIKSILAIVSALIYLFSPIDLIPDFIPFYGYVDDAAVLGFVLKMVEDDVVKYKEWQEKNGKRLVQD